MLKNDMKPSFTTIEDGKKLLAEYWESYPVLSETDKIKEWLTDNIETVTPELLSRALMKLSIYLCNIGGIVAQITAEANEAYMHRKFQYLWEFTSLRAELKGKERENTALDNTFKHHKQELINRFVADFMKEYKEDLERVVMSMQSRLKTLQGEKIASYMDAKSEQKEY